MVWSLIGCATPLQLSFNGNEAVFRSHTTVVVLPLEDSSDPIGSNDEQKKAYKDTLKAVSARFSDYLTQEIRQRGLYAAVLTRQEQSFEPTLIISGFITKYDKGNSVLRRLIGFGVGSSVFTALIEFRDSKSGKIIGTITNNGTSWVGGGVIAQSQSAEVLMHDAAAHIASELWRVRNN